MKKILHGAVALAMLAGLSLSADAQTTQTTMMQQIIISDNMSQTLPNLNVRAGEDLLLHVVNPTDEAVLVMFPDLGLNYWVPANSEQNLLVDISPVQGEMLTYQVVTEEGQLLAYGDVVNSGSIEVALADLEQSLIASRETYLITAQDLEDEEPEYYPTQPASRAVRGYW